MSYNLLTILMIAGIVLSAIFMLFPQPVVRLFAVGFNTQTFDLTVVLSKTMMWALTPILIINLISSYLQINGPFLLPASYSIIINTFIISSIFLSSPNNTGVLSTGALLGFVFAACAIMLQSARSGFRYKPILAPDENIRKIFTLFIPVFLSSMVTQISKILDRTFASVLDTGTVSAMNYASKLQDFISALFVASLAIVLFPEISKLDSEKDIKMLKSYTIQSLNAMSIVLMPIIMGAIVLAEPIVRTLFMRGAFNEAAVRLTSESLSFYSIGFLALGFNMILTRVFHSLQDTRTPAINSIIAVSLNILLNFLLIDPMVHRGLALATSISGIVTTAMLLRSLWKKIGGMGMKGLLTELSKAAFASLLMGISVWIVHRMMQPLLSIASFKGNLLVLVVCVVSGATLYCVLLLLLLRVKQVHAVWQRIISRTNGRNV